LRESFARLINKQQVFGYSKRVFNIFFFNQQLIIMSKFSFRSNSGLIHVYEYLENAQISAYEAIDNQGNVVISTPAICRTLSAHLARVTLDFNCNNDLGLWDDTTYQSTRKPPSLLDSKITTAQFDAIVDNFISLGFKDQMTDQPNDGLPDDLNEPISVNHQKWAHLLWTNMRALWDESKTAFLVITIITVSAVIALVPATILCLPIMLIMFILDTRAD
jgi:hypothetical protein